MEQSHECEGKVYEKEVSYFGRSVIRVGIDDTHTYKHIINGDRAASVNVGDVVKILVSDEYSRVNKVIDWEVEK